ncbi:MAG: EAL domain-containing protein [Hyphomicrobiales bacterium]|nr:EAL domain-containing protein [Hyphomicrobiales bacterium]
MRFASVYDWVKDKIGDEKIETDLLQHFVDSLFVSPISLYASMAMALLTSGCAYYATEDRIMLWFFLAHIAVGAVRIAIVARYRSMRPNEITRSQILFFDRVFLVAAALYAGLIGWMSAILSRSHDLGMDSLATGLTVGFCIAFITRSSGRLKTLTAQIVLVVAPTIYVHVVEPLHFGGVIAVALIGMMISAIIMGYVANGRIAELFYANQKTRRLAWFDTLSGVQNRYSFSETLDKRLKHANAARRQNFLLAVIDLDRFKEINDTLGHTLGDAVIVRMARRLEQAIGPDDVLARLGGDEFVVIAMRAAEEAESFGLRLVEALAQSLTIDQTAIPTSASVGVAIYPDHGRDSADLMKAADIALYEAKRAGRRSARVFTAEMREKVEQKRILELEMTAAVGLGQFEPWFQPICDFQTGKPVAFEALARWRHPARGVISPMLFIPVAEHSGAIFQIGDQILEKACIAATAWPEHICVQVNLSPVQFRRPDHLLASIRSSLEKSGLQPQRLCLEFTESLLMEDSETTREAVRAIAAMGVKLALDDFGVGYSSLSYIQTYPFSEIKIDKKFVDNIETDATSAAIVAAIRILADRIKVDLVVEGVETERQRQALIDLGVKTGQGFLFGAPAQRAGEAPPPAASAA